MRKYSKFLFLSLFLVTIIAITGVSAADSNFSDNSTSDATTLNSVNNVNVLSDDNVSSDNGTNSTENTTVEENHTFDTSIDVSVNDSAAFDPSVINISVIGNNSTVNGGNVSVVIINGNSTVYNKTVQIVDGNAVVKWTPKKVGDYTINVEFNGFTVDNITYNPSKTEKTYTATVNNNLIVDVKNITMYYRDGTKYVVVVRDQDGNPISEVPVQISVCGKTYSRVTDENGSAYLSLRLINGTYAVNATITNTTSTNSSNVVIKNWNSSLINIVPENLTKYYKDQNQLKVHVSHNGSSLEKVDVYFVVLGKTYKRTTDENGTAKMTINLKPGTYNIDVFVKCVDGNPSNNTKVVVKKWNKNDVKFVVNKLTKNYRDSNKFTAKLTYNGYGIAGEKVKFTLGKKTYTRTTNSDGVASLNINYNVGKYTGSASINTQGVKLSGKNTIQVNPAYVSLDIKNKVNSFTGQTENGTFVLYYNIKKGNKLQLQFTFNGKPMVNKYVNVTINKKSQILKTDKNGYVYAKTNNAKTGCQNVTVIYYSFDKNFHSLLWNLKINFQ